MSIATRLLVTLTLGLGLTTAAMPAAAETVYLKNGTQVSGSITKEDAETLVVETREGRRKVPKGDIDVYPTPDPAIALATGLMLSGGGHVYSGIYDRAALFFGLSAVGGAAGYFAARQIRPTSPSTAAVTAIVAYGIPMLVGAYDGFRLSEQLKSKPKYKIDYSTAE